MKKVIIFLVFWGSILYGQNLTDSLQVTHFALNVYIKSMENGYLKVADNFGNTHFQGIYQPEAPFTQILVLPMNAESLYVALGDSLQVLQIDNNMSELKVKFVEKRAGIKKRLMWLLHDLQTVFPIIALAIIFIIKKQKDKKAATQADEENEIIGN